MSAVFPLWNRLKGRCQRTAAAWFGCRRFRLQNTQPLISFTFDDFPRSALHIAGDILKEHGAVGTYYTSLGLMGQLAPTGKIFTASDLPFLLERGHELGCHTYHHHHAFNTPTPIFEQSILQNHIALQGFCPGATFATHSYPISCPRPSTKQCCARYFLASRAGGQIFNSGVIDRENLCAFFLEQDRDRPDYIKALVDTTIRSTGWLVFATHDVESSPTRYGCTPEFFREIVRYAAASGAHIMPVARALEACGLKSEAKLSVHAGRE